MNNKIEIYGIYAEDLFEWFLNHVENSCGDGCGLLVCKNYIETAEYFRDWYRQEKGGEFRYSPDKSVPGIVNYHDGNENFIFSNHWFPLFKGDYSFIVKENCSFAMHYNSEFNHYITSSSIIEAV